MPSRGDHCPGNQFRSRVATPSRTRSQWFGDEMGSERPVVNGDAAAQEIVWVERLLIKRSIAGEKTKNKLDCLTGASSLLF